MIIGIGDFRGGETRRTRVTPDEVRKLKWCGGWDTSLGHLRPDVLPALRGPGPASDPYSGGTPPAQIPFCFRDAAERYIIYRDSDKRLWVQGRADDYDYDFAGRDRACTFYDIGEARRVDCDAHGLEAGDKLVFGSTADGVTAGTVYHVLPGEAENYFQIAQGYGTGGDPLNLTHDIQNTFRAFRGDVLDTIADGGPCRVGNLLIFPTAGETAALRAFEVEGEDTGGNHLTMRTRPLGLKGPTDYSDTEAPAAVASAHPAALNAGQVWNLNTEEGGAHWAATLDGSMRGGSVATNADWDALQIASVATPQLPAAGKLYFTYDLGAAGKAITHATYFCFDVVVQWGKTDPAQQIVVAGEFVNGEQTVWSSGYELQLYWEQPTHSGFDTDHVLCTYKIPQFDTTGRVNRVLIHLRTSSQACTFTASDPNIACSGHPYSVGDRVSFGTALGGLAAGTVYYVVDAPANTFKVSDAPGGEAILPSAGGANTVGRAVRGLGIRTASNWVAPETSGYYTLYLYSHDWCANWAYTGNTLLPAAASTLGHWHEALPPDPGSKGTSAVVLETFPESYADFSPHRPWVRWLYAHRGRSELGSDDYKVLISNPSVESAWYLADPWVSYDVTATFPSDGTDTVLSEYTDGTSSGGMGYLTDILWYRAERDAEQIWSDFTFFAASHLTDFTVTGVTVTDDGTEAEAEIDSLPVPEMVEANHDYPSSARYVVSSDGRIYALCLSWDDANERWSRPKDMEVSNWQDYDSFPTTTSDPPEDTEGEELTDFATDSYGGMGLLARQQSKFIFTDNAFYELVGMDPIQGWDFLRRDTVGCKDARTIADCRSEIIWHDGTDFYAYAGGLSEPISKGLVDSSLIDWAEPFGAAFARDQYVFFCHHDDPDADTPYCLMIFDLQTRSWRRRYSESYQLAGICSDTDSSTVYGITHEGKVVDLFGGTTDYGGAQTYDVCTQYLVIAPPGEERHVSNGLLEVVTAEDETPLSVEFCCQGRAGVGEWGPSPEDPPVSRALTVVKGKTLYADPELNVDLVGDAVAVRVRYTGPTPPDIHFIGVNVDEAIAG